LVEVERTVHGSPTTHITLAEMLRHATVPTTLAGLLRTALTEKPELAGDVPKGTSVTATEAGGIHPSLANAVSLLNILAAVQTHAAMSDRLAGVSPTDVHTIIPLLVHRFVQRGAAGSVDDSVHRHATRQQRLQHRRAADHHGRAEQAA